jgi:nitrous oxide reductase accessory protein NosL
MRTSRVLGLSITLALAGCAKRSGPPPIAVGTPCADCGMSIEDLRYACETERGDTVRAYDSIECLLREPPLPARAWLTDYDSRTLHAADSVWVVKAEIPSPMGGGYAAFMGRGAADEIAASRNGQVGRLGDFVKARP